MARRIVVIDYGMGNLRSVSKAVEHVADDAEVLVTDDPAVIALATTLLLFGAAFQYVDGRLIIRGCNRIICYDLRQKE